MFCGDDTWFRLFPKRFENGSEGTVSFFVSDYTEVWLFLHLLFCVLFLHLLFMLLLFIFILCKIKTFQAAFLR